MRRTDAVLWSRFVGLFEKAKLTPGGMLGHFEPISPASASVSEDYALREIEVL